MLSAVLYSTADNWIYIKLWVEQVFCFLLVNSIVNLNYRFWILGAFTPLSTVETCINSNQKEKASSNPCRSSRLFLEMFWLRNTRWSHCLSEASLRLSCMLLAGRLSHRTTERRSRCADAFLYRLLEKYRRLCAFIVEYKQQFPKFFTEF